MLAVTRGQASLLSKLEILLILSTLLEPSHAAVVWDTRSQQVNWGGTYYLFVTHRECIHAHHDISAIQLRKCNPEISFVWPATSPHVELNSNKIQKYAADFKLIFIENMSYTQCLFHIHFDRRNIICLLYDCIVYVHNILLTFSFGENTQISSV